MLKIVDIESIEVKEPNDKETQMLMIAEEVEKEAMLDKSKYEEFYL